jgi:3-oxoacyl-[acyl-carrier-protein] synthase II
MSQQLHDRSVVVTGIGLVTPLATGTEETWQAALACKSGVDTIKGFDASAFPTRIAGEVSDFDAMASKFVDAKELRRNDRFIHFALAAAQLAIEDSGLDPSKEDGDRIGVVIGSGMGGIATIEETLATLKERGLRKVSPFFVPSVVINLAGGQVSLRYGFRGPSFAPVSACATGNHAIGDAMLMIERGMCDVVIAGGAEATITPLGLAGFVAARAMSERNDAPGAASRPFDKGRDGFVAAEGSGVLVLESVAHARKRGAKMRAWLSGYGASSDAHHITSPAPDGNGALRAMKMAIEMAGLTPNDIGHVNAHATSTPAGDIAECKAMQALFGEHLAKVPVTGTKSLTGHMLGAAGAVEAGLSVLSLERGIIPPTKNVDDLDPECGAVDVVRNTAREVKFDAVLSNGFGFGGTNASVVFRRVPA